MCKRIPITPVIESHIPLTLSVWLADNLAGAFVIANGDSARVLETELRMFEEATLRKELSLLNASLVNVERAIEAISIPTGDDAREVKRLDSLASLTVQQTRDLRRRNDLQEQFAKIQASVPDRKTIRRAIKNLEGLWEHLTMGERSRLMSQLVARIDHDPTDSTLAITLSPLGLKSFATENPDKEESEKS